jgi:hypothetical protein
LSHFVGNDASNTTLTFTSIISNSIHISGNNIFLMAVQGTQLRLHQYATSELQTHCVVQAYFVSVCLSVPFTQYGHTKV